MTDMTAFVQKASLTGAAPTYTPVTASDKFRASPGSKYILHYKNGATAQATGSMKVTDATTPTPSGAAPGAGFADAVVVAAPLASSAEAVVEIDNSNRFIDATGYINLTATGTLTTVTVAIIGPL